jgi:hypothetical protein
MSFLSGVANTFGSSPFGRAMDNKAGVSENTPRSLWKNSNNPNSTVDSGPLGQLQTKVDLSAQRAYIESGYISYIKPKYAEMVLQNPDVTIGFCRRS